MKRNVFFVLTVMLMVAFSIGVGTVFATEKANNATEPTTTVKQNTESTPEPSVSDPQATPLEVEPTPSSAQPEEVTLDTLKKSFTYRAHVANIGWLDTVKLGEIGGTTGKGYQLEALRIDTGVQDKSVLGVKYRAHVQNIGWQDYAENDAEIGTTGKSLRIEALSIALTGTKADQFDIYYRIHVQNIGWLDWAKNGEDAGTADFGYRAEAVEIQIVNAGDPAPGNTDIPFLDHTKITNGSLTYSAHSKNKGWEQGYVAAGETAGYTGQSLQMEALKIDATADNLFKQNPIQYRAHVQNIGWQGWSNNNKEAGTVGRGLRIEALEIKPTGPMASAYDIYYRVHMAHLGWLDWAKNGQSAGSTGFGLAVEAVEIQLVPKGAEAPGETTRPFITQEYIKTLCNVNYQSHVQNIGWQNWVKNGEQAGTTGRSLRLEAFLMNLSGEMAEGSSISYQAHLNNTGWEGWKNTNQVAGGPGASRRIECLQIQLGGKAAIFYDIYYHVYVQNIGWLEWTKNGEWAGTTNGSLRIEAMSAVLVPKGSPAPGPTGDHYRYIPDKPKFDYGWMPITDTCICIDIGAQHMNAYIGRNKVVDTDVITGAPGMDTPRGNFVINSKESPSILVGPDYRTWVAFWVAFVGNDIGIHDSSWQDPYGYGGNAYQTGRGSHGCVNTPYGAVQAIYTLFPVGTPVFVR